VGAYSESLEPAQRAIVEHILSCSAIGSPPTVKAAIEEFVARTSADELIVTSQIFDHGKRLRSFEIVSELFLQDQAKIPVAAK
jgi:alkanesulfonate monooxygenase SsuD/methylene tetrahydromethanopterin reductase-like flavin-dependent oxidoreductase (luciferase family)